MKKRISECLSSPEASGQMDRAIESFMLNTVEESGLRMPNLQQMMDSARECLERFTYQIPEPKYSSHLVINSLGRVKGKEDADKAIRKTSWHMAQILGAYAEDITLSVSSVSDGTSSTDTRFIVSSNAPTREPLISMIRSAYGKVEARLDQAPEDFAIGMYATGNMIFRGKAAEKQLSDKEYEKCEPWITAVLSALPENGNYTVKMRFAPVQNRTAVREKLTSLNTHYRQLRLYGNLNWNNSLNLGRSLNEGQNIVGGMVGTDTSGYSSTYAMSLSSQDIHKEAMLLTDRLEHAITRLSRIGDESLWAVYISISAQDMDTIQTLTSLLTSSLFEANIHLSWKRKPDASPMLALHREILPMLMFPIKEFSGFNFVQNEEFSLISRKRQQDSFPVGSLLWNGTPVSSFCLSPVDLTRHAFICGMTGSGKTNTVFKIIEGVDLPFCVIEPVKGEYRALRSAYPDLQVWTMKVTDNSNSNVNVMQINPFWFPCGGNLAFHIDSLKTIIASAFELTAAMPNILEQCLYNIYVKAGWDLVTNRNIYRDKLPERYLYPTFDDLCNEVECYLNNSDFSGDLMGDYKGALLSRLKSFVSGYKGILLNTDAHPDYGRIMCGHSVLELEGLADDADKCLVMGTILVQYYQYLKLHFSVSGQKLKHLLVIEEAHRLFKNTKNKRPGQEGSDPTGQLVNSLSNMMAEIRAFGEGMLIVDQSPTKVAEDVIKNSATKIVHRIDNSNDIKAMQSAMLLDDTLSFAALAQGEALIRTDGMERPSKVRMVCSQVKEAYNLAESFRTGELSVAALADVFIANSVLADEKTAELVQERITVFLNSLVLCGIDRWYELVGNLLCDIMGVLRERKRSDEVDYKMSVLFEIVSGGLKRLYRGESKRNFGAVHMFVMRLLDFFRDKRDGRFINPGAVELFRQYLQTNVAEVVRSACLDSAGVQLHTELCHVAELDPRQMASMMVTSFIHDILPALEYRKTVPGPEFLMDSFLSSSVALVAWDSVAEKDLGAFEKLSVYLQKMVD